MAEAKRPGVGINLDAPTLARLDAIAAELTKAAAGATVTRTNAARAALLLGMEALEKRLGLVPPDTPSP